MIVSGELRMPRAVYPRCLFATVSKIRTVAHILPTDESTVALCEAVVSKEHRFEILSPSFSCFVCRECWGVMELHF